MDQGWLPECWNPCCDFSLFSDLAVFQVVRESNGRNVGIVEAIKSDSCLMNGRKVSEEGSGCAQFDVLFVVDHDCPLLFRKVGLLSGGCELFGLT